MDADSSSISRRALLVRSIAIASLSLAGAARADAAMPGGKASKADFFYQDRPKDGKSCSTCRLFLPADGGSGACALLAGPISPTGWCMGYSARG